MVSEIGKILDPIADKLTQCVLIVCLLSEYPLLRAVFALFLVKEILVAAAGYKVLEKTEHNDGARSERLLYASGVCHVHTEVQQDPEREKRKGQRDSPLKSKVNKQIWMSRGCQSCGVLFLFLRSTVPVPGNGGSHENGNIRKISDSSECVKKA